MAVKRPITSAKVLELLRDGFQLACGTYIRGGATIWMQREIGCGGESFSVHASSFYSLREKGLIEAVPGQSRFARSVLYRLAPTAPTTGATHE